LIGAYRPFLLLKDDRSDCEGYLKYLLLDNAASIERGMNGDSLLLKIHFFVGESGSFRNLDLSCSRFFASSDDVGAASIRVFEGVLDW
jgi:hypothetical protein